MAQPPESNPPPPGEPVPPSAPTYQAPPPPEPQGYGYGAAAIPAGMYYDQGSGLLLPQGTQLAPIGRRIGAYFLAIPLAIVTLGIGYVVWGLIVWPRGTSPALQVLGMRCWRPDTNSTPGFWRMALREIVGRFVEGLLSVVTEIVSFVLMVSNPKRQCLHDLIAGTVVLHDPNKVLG
ncbi:MAG TPA: RDD family protein [Acidimicrobiales bacterium]|nr:RDD family protein [Acidimicrobiales bacterium]